MTGNAAVQPSGVAAPADDVTVDEGGGSARRLTGAWGMVVQVLAVGTTVFHLLALTVYPLDPWVFLGTSLGLFWILALLLFPASRLTSRGVTPVDLAWIVAAVGVIAYLAWNYDAMYDRVGFEPSTADWIVGLAALLLTLETSRRVLGWFFPVLSLAFVLYAVAGGALPGIWGHRGYEFDRVVSTLFSTEGLYGFAMAAAATYIVLFVTFGAFLRATGVGPVFMQLATAIAGCARGGPAKVAVLSSAMFGTISGSSMGNVATVGTLTIPLMKRIGYPPAFAGAVEAAASTGGQIMPPVMGSVAFVLAEATLTPYRDVMLAALIPAICYFATIYFVIDFEAVKLRLRGTTAEETPRLTAVLRDGWLLLVPIMCLVVLIVFAGRSVVQSAIVSVGVALVADFIRRRRPIHWRDGLKALAEGTTGAIEAVCACACAGILVGVFSLTGLGNRFVDLVLAYGQDQLALALLIVMLVTILLGFPLPTVAAYIITAAVGAPVLAKLGVPVLAAHLFIMYYACVSTLTPPVALAAFTAAGIAGSDPNRTSWIATRLSIAAYIVPFVFIYNPAILWEGSWHEILRALMACLLAGYAFAGATNGYHHPFARVLLFLCAVAMLAPDPLVNAAGVALVAAIVLASRAHPGLNHPASR
ncbi:MAG TPA: TRAP transporter fused permease subunit [Burkholderiales bacterium]|nr:TRAP transporter fused permease subunit [Burkholderiales bacterium]